MPRFRLLTHSNRNNLIFALFRQVLLAVFFIEASCHILSAQSDYSEPYSFTSFAGGLPHKRPSVDGLGPAASFRSPQGVAVDAAGNVYVADTSNYQIRKISPAGVVTTLAGSGSAGTANGTGSAASFGSPAGLAVDAAGNVYVADSGDDSIRKVSPAGVVTTLAGSGLSGSSDDIGVDASFWDPSGVTVDAAGNVYVADSLNNKIRKISPDGIVTTLAGSGLPGSVNGTGSAASFDYPTSVAVDTAGNVYVADHGNHKIRKISPTGIVTTFAGSGAGGSSDGTSTVASFFYPKGISVDATGNVYVTSSSKIRKITPAGIVTTLAGADIQGISDGTGSTAYFQYPTGVAADVSGNVYVADTSNHVIRKIAQTGVVTTFAGAGSPTSVDGTGTAANFYSPQGLAVDETGNLYVADVVNNKIRKISPTGVVTTLAGSGSWGSSDGTGSVASFAYPGGVAVDTTGNVYVADTLNNKIRKISPDAIVTTLAGSGLPGSVNGTGSAASFDAPYGIAVDRSGNVYVADSTNNKIRKISPTGIVSTFAGSGSEGSANGTGSAASFYAPVGVVVDTVGNLYVADLGNNKIRKITPTGIVTTLAGSGAQGSSDGAGSVASFYRPWAITVEGTGSVYVADTGNHKIRKISPTGDVTTLAGSGSAGSADGIGAATNFNFPLGVAVNAAGDLYVADSSNNTIRRGVSTGLAPKPQKITVNTPSGITTQTPPFSITASSDSKLPITLTLISGPATLSGTTVTLTPAVGTVIIKAEQAGNDTYAAAAPITFSFTVSKAAQSITFPSTPTKTLPAAPFALSAAASSGLPVTFSVVSGPATLSGNTLTLTGPGTVKIRATQAGNSLYSEAAAVDQSFAVYAKPVITNRPVSATIILGASVTFKVTATGTPAPGYQWRFKGKDIKGATKSSYSITKTVSTQAGDYTVVVKNSAGSATSSVARLSFGTAPKITKQPVSLTLTSGKPATFAVSVTGSPTVTYQWRRNSVNIAGATKSSYAISKVATTHAGVYSVVIKNVLGTVTSASVRLTVNTKPVITTQPANNTVVLGKPASFKVVATGIPSPTYQWRLNGKNIRGATKSTYSISRTTASHDGSYTVVVSNSVSSVTSTTAKLAFGTLPKITKQPVGRTVTELGSATFSVTATGSPAVTYQWRRNGSNISGATKSTYTISSTSPARAGDYTVVVKNATGTVTSSVAKLTVTPAPAPSFLLTGSVILYTGTGIDSPEGPFTENKTVVIGASNIIADGTYIYNRTSATKATITHETTIAELDYTENETSTVLLTFISPTGGTYTSAGSYEGIETPGGPYEGTFSSSGTFTYNPKP